MEQDPNLISPEDWAKIKGALLVGGATQKELLDYLGVSRPGLVRKRELEQVIALAKRPRGQWTVEPGTASNQIAESNTIPATVLQVEELKAEAKRVGLSDLDVSGLLQRNGASRWEDLSEERAEWLLGEFKDLPAEREAGADD
jgi:hypothetical protein